MTLPVIYTSALLDTRRRGLGLSVPEMAAWCGVGGEKSVRNWLNGSNPPRDPASVLARLDDLEHLMLDRVTAVVDMAAEATDAGPVILYRHREQEPGEDAIPNGAHAVMIQWATEALEDEGIAVQIEWAGEAHS